MRHLIHCIAFSGCFQITVTHKTIALSGNGRPDSLYHIQWTQDNKCAECESLSGYFQITGWHKTITALSVNARSDSLYCIQWIFPDHRKTQDNNCTECECEIWFTVLHPVNISRSQEDTRQLHWVWMRDLIPCLSSSGCFQITVRYKTISLSMNERSDDLYPIKWKFPDHRKTQQLHWEWMRDLMNCIPSSGSFQITGSHETFV